MNEITPVGKPRRTGHEEAWDLLPWYVNGSLDEAERAGVEEHLAACGICREEARYWHGFAELSQEEGDLVVTPQEGLERVRRRRAVGAAFAGAPRPTPRPEPRRRRFALLRDTPAPVRWLVAAQLAGLLLLGALLAAPGGPGDLEGSAPPAAAAFRTLSDPVPASAADAGERLVRVVFSDQVRERALRGALISVGGKIVDGPSATGVYTVAVAPEDDLDAILETLRSLPQVLLAEPAVAARSAP